MITSKVRDLQKLILRFCPNVERFALRLANSKDRGHITSAVTDNLEGLTSMLPILRTVKLLYLVKLLSFQ